MNEIRPWIVVSLLLVLFKCTNSVDEEITANCVTSFEISINVLNQPDHQENNGRIEVIVDGDNQGLAFSLDDMTYQQSTLFSGLEDGLYHLYAKDNLDCKWIFHFELIEGYPLSKLTVVGGHGSGNYRVGSFQQISANESEKGKQFAYWIGDTSVVQNVNEKITEIVIPDFDLSVEAFFEEVPLYVLTVINGSGAGSYEQNAEVAIEANQSSNGRVFEQWIGDIQHLVNSNIEDQIVTVQIPDADVAFEATYADAVSYTRDVAPLFVLHCTSKGCHVTNDGNGERSLLTYNDQVKRASAIRNSIILGGMPQDGEMPNEDINTIVAWIDTGTPNN